MSECSFCGWCETPDRCVWSVTCPKCHADPKRPCHAPGNVNRLEGLHAERWRAAGLDWRALEEIAEAVGLVPKALPLMVERHPRGMDARVVDSVLYALSDWEELRRIEEENDGEHELLPIPEHAV